MRNDPTVISVEIRDEQKVCSLNHAAIRAFLKEALRFLLPGNSCRLSLALVEDDQIARFNARYLGKNRPTDVLAFSMQEGKALAGDTALLGDVMISTETAGRNAKRFRYSFEKELALYLLHGVLHLLGYDDKTPSERQRMRRRELGLLRRCSRTVSLRTLTKR